VTYIETGTGVAIPNSTDNEHRQSASYTDTNGACCSMNDVWLSTAYWDTESPNANPVAVSAVFDALPEMHGAQDLDISSRAANRYYGCMKVDAITAIFQLGAIAVASCLGCEYAVDPAAALQHLERLSSNLHGLRASCSDFLLALQSACNVQGNALTNAMSNACTAQLPSAGTAGDDALTYKVPSKEIGAQAANGNFWRQAA
jgi:hypothetical protein